MRVNLKSGIGKKSSPVFDLVRRVRIDRAHGLLIALTSATLLFFGVIESGVAALIGIVGIGLIGAWGAGYAASHSKNGKL